MRRPIDTGTRPILTLTLTMAAATLAPAQTVHFVNGAAAPGGNGLSWPTAYRHLTQALQAAQTGDQIWVAMGTYRPDESSLSPNGTGDRAASFQLVSAVAVYGGFAGTETQLEQRDPAVNVTILSGDLNGDDGPNFANYGDNSYHVLTASGVNATAILDGFTVLGGNADLPSSATDSSGGGLICLSGSPTVRGCIFRDNVAGVSGEFGAKGGGALRVDEGSAPIVSRCLFLENASRGSGGAIDMTTPTPFAPLFTNCLFIGNTASLSAPYGGGAVAMGAPLARFVNCTFTGNVAHDGGAVHIGGASGGLINCTLSNNSASGLGGAVLTGADTAPAVLHNSILWGNVAASGGIEAQQIFVQLGPVDVRRCAVQGLSVFAGNGNIASDPLFRDDDGPDNISGTIDDDLRLANGSPCIDAGDNTAVPSDTADLDNDGNTAEPTPYDAGNNGRFREFWTVPDTGLADSANPTLPIVDMGAYEHVGGQVLVSPNPAETAWVDDTDSLQAALEFARGYPDEVTEIWVAAGTYKPDYWPGVIAPGDRTASFELVSGVAVYGGFAGNETALAQRDPDANVTILSGDLAGDDDPDVSAWQLPDATRAENSHHVVVGSGRTRSAILDGFTITGGHADGPSGFNGPFDGSGAGVLNIAGSPTIRNCAFVLNVAAGPDAQEQGGGAIYNRDGSEPLIVGSRFVRNRALATGGAAYQRLITGGPNATFVNCTFSGNLASQGGGAVWNVAPGTMANCTFAGNVAQGNGGAIDCGSASPNIINCTLTQNVTITGNGGGLYTSAGGPAVRNCILWQNTAQDGAVTGEAAQLFVNTGGWILTSTLLDGLNPSGPFAGNGNIATDPLFRRGAAAGDDTEWGTPDDDYGDLRLGFGSPAIDAGDNAAVAPDAADLDGDGNTAEVTPLDLAGATRVVDDPCTTDTGIGPAPVVDMGAYEYPEPAPPQPVIYVKADATGANNGTTWTNAFRSLEAALCAASLSGGIVEEIWVAAATYRPTKRSVPTDPRSATFQLLNGVAIYGGFAGGELLLSERDPAAYPTVLTGDSAGNDDELPTSGGAPATWNENVFHVVTATGADETAVLDGLIITHGHAFGAPDQRGAGLYIRPGSPTILNCTFTESVASGGGGAGIFDGSNPVFERCRFIDCRAPAAGGDGGGAAVVNNGTTAFRDCEFTRCQAFDAGGGLYFGAATNVVSSCRFERNSANRGAGIASLGSAQLHITGCAFVGNAASFLGGGTANIGTAPTIVNCSFSGNTALGGPSSQGGAIFNNVGNSVIDNCSLAFNVSTNGGGIYTVGAAPTISNCVLWQNANASGVMTGQQVRVDSANPGNATVNYSIVQGGWSGAGGIGIINSDPLFTTPPDPGLDGDWDGVNDNYGDLRLLAGSPAIDAGSNVLVAADAADLDCDGNKLERTPLDLDGAPRFVDDPAANGGVSDPPGAPIVDMGAYERGPLVGSAVFVKANATGANDGTSWANAYTNLQSALAYAQGAGCGALEVWVAAGTYRPTQLADPADPRSATFQLLDGVVLYGGFAGTETDLAQRNPAVNVTILSGDIGVLGDPADNAYHVVTGTGNSAVAILDGFTITGGNAVCAGGDACTTSGGGLVTLGGGPTLRNCIIEANNGACGGGIASLGGNVALANVTVQDNSAPTGGQVTLAQSRVELAGLWSLPSGLMEVFGAQVSGPGTLDLGSGALLNVRSTPSCGVESIASVAGPLGLEMGEVTVFAPQINTQPPVPARWELLSAPMSDLIVSGAATHWVIAPSGQSAPALLNWTGNFIQTDLSVGGLAEAVFFGNGTLTLTGRIYDAGALPPTLIYDSNLPGNSPLLTATVEGFQVREMPPPAEPDQLEFVVRPRITPTGGFLVQNGLGFALGGRQLLDLTFSPAQQDGGALVDFDPDSAIALTGVSTLSIEPESPPSVILETRSDIRGTGDIEIDPGASLVLAGSATLNLSGLPDDVCGGQDEPGAPEGGTVSVNGTLLVQDSARVHNTNVEVNLLGLSGTTQIVHNDITLLESSTGFGGEFFATGNATISCNTIVSEGDRYLDLDPDPDDGVQPTLINNRIIVIIKQGVTGEQGELLELRSPDVNYGDGASGAYQLAASSGYSDTWALEKLEVLAGAKVNLTNRQGFDFTPGSGLPEALYVKELVLHPGAVLNTGLQRLYYQTLTMDDTAELTDVPVLGFSLKVIAMEDGTEFAVRVRRRLRDELDVQPAAPPFLEGSITRAENLDPLDPVNGVMDMQTLTASSVAAKGAFARAGEAEVVVAFQYRFVENPDAELRVYLSDDPDVSENVVPIATVYPPASGRAGAIDSDEFATFYGLFPRGELNFHRGTYVELELTAGTGIPSGSSRLLIDDWDPQIECLACADLNGNAGVEAHDYLLLLASAGTDTTSPPAGQQNVFCLDSVLGGDKYVDLADLLGWDTILNQNDPPPPNACGLNLQTGAAGAGASLPANTLVLAGKPNVAGQQDDALYPVTASGALAGAVQAPASAAGPGGQQRGNGRLVKDASGGLHQLHAVQGLIRLSDGAVVVAPSEQTFAGNTVRIGVMPLNDGLGGYAGLPIADAAFDAANANVVYVVPVEVTPSGGGYCQTSRAAARLLLTQGGYTVDELYMPPAGTSVVGCGAIPEPALGELREIELSPDGATLFVASAQAVNDNDWLLTFSTGGALQELALLSELVPSSMSLKAPQAMTVGQADGEAYLYLTAGVPDVPDGRARVFRLSIEPSLAFAGALDVAQPPCGDLGLGCEAAVTTMAHDTITGALSLAGFTLPRLAVDHPFNAAPFIVNGATGPIFTTPTLAQILASAGWSMTPPTAAAVNATALAAGNLALPISLAINGGTTCAPSGDVDADGDRDLRDVAGLQACFTASGSFVISGACSVFNANCDADVDLPDFAAVLPLTGP